MGTWSNGQRSNDPSSNPAKSTVNRGGTFSNRITYAAIRPYLGCFWRWAYVAINSVRNITAIRSKVMTSFDKIGRFNALWATFQRLWQQLICPSLHFETISVKASKTFIFLVKSFLGIFFRHLTTFYWSHWLGHAIWSTEILINLGLTNVKTNTTRSHFIKQILV